MTSMPASRSARAMTLAPRSWPSRPGFAITTRIFLGHPTFSCQLQRLIWRAQALPRPQLTRCPASNDRHFLVLAPRPRAARRTSRRPWRTRGRRRASGIIVLPRAAAVSAQRVERAAARDRRRASRCSSSSLASCVLGAPSRRCRGSGSAGSSACTKSLTPTMIFSLRSTACWKRYDASAISCCGKPRSIASTMPPIRSIVSK